MTSEKWRNKALKRDLQSELTDREEEASRKLIDFPHPNFHSSIHKSRAERVHVSRERVERNIPRENNKMNFIGKLQKVRNQWSLS